MIDYFGTELSQNQLETAEGFLVCRNVPIARTGEMVYLARELQLDGDPDRLVHVRRGERDVFDPQAMASFEGKPVTDGHPPESVGPENFSAYARGHIQNVRREGDYLMADLYINDASLASDVRNRVKREVSCGYLCVYTPEGNGYRQGQIRGNHVAVVPRGRAGHEVAIKDAAQKAEKGRETMSEFWRSVLTAFGKAAKDAEPEELEQMVTTTAAVLDSAPGEKREEPAEPEPAGQEEKSAVDALAVKLDQVLDMLSSLQTKEPKEELRGETALDSLLASLGPGAEPLPPDDGMSAAARDAALAMIKSIRPAVAAIKDEKERSRVVDALLESVKGPDMMAQVEQNVQANARQALDSAPMGFEARCKESEAAYAARNPHKKKED